jgi:hypothetical protein
MVLLASHHNPSNPDLTMLDPAHLLKIIPIILPILTMLDPDVDLLAAALLKLFRRIVFVFVALGRFQCCNTSYNERESYYLVIDKPFLNPNTVTCSEQ